MTKTDKKEEEKKSSKIEEKTQNKIKRIIIRG